MLLLRTARFAKRVTFWFEKRKSVNTYLVDTIRGGTYGVTPDKVQPVEQNTVHAVEFWIDGLGHIVERRYTTHIYQNGLFRGVALDEVITINILESLSLEPPI